MVFLRKDIGHLIAVAHLYFEHKEVQLVVIQLVIRQGLIRIQAEVLVHLVLGFFLRTEHSEETFGYVAYLARVVIHAKSTWLVFRSEGGEIRHLRGVDAFDSRDFIDVRTHRERIGRWHGYLGHDFAMLDTQACRVTNTKKRRVL